MDAKELAEIRKRREDAIVWGTYATDRNWRCIVNDMAALLVHIEELEASRGRLRKTGAMACQARDAAMNTDMATWFRCTWEASGAASRIQPRDIAIGPFDSSPDDGAY